MTYLTERGLRMAQDRRLQGIKTETGDWRILESNLRVSDISRLVRNKTTSKKQARGFG
jgi:hypothetical protein